MKENRKSDISKYRGNKEVTAHERIRRTPAEIARKREAVAGKDGGTFGSEAVQYQPLRAGAVGSLFGNACKVCGLF